MNKGKKLQDLVESNPEIGYDEKLSYVMDLSVNIKQKSRIVNEDGFGIASYYVCISDKEGFSKKIDSLDQDQKEALYVGIRRPLLLIENNKTVIFEQDPDHVNPMYTTREITLSNKKLMDIKGMYNKGAKPDIKEDKKYSTMYKLSSKIKREGIKIIMKEENLNFYLTELSNLKENGSKIIKYISNLNKDDFETLSYIIGPFYIIDTKKKIGYSMEMPNKDNDEGIPHFKVSDSNEYDAFYNILETVKKVPSKIVTIEDKQENEEYKPSGTAPSDLYR
ncbi:MAG: hypothetical protein BJBARM5_0052 [Candidatus Parvarchaeum acidophilus ARMAN-5]|uniref:Uncharacterized protein n=1 Tax=Candidatus Parvarchaeum acidophilus ARMAN-5 TaxID=662762 RepID=D6GUC5_PARA5|nr:MAG: hypothetical protein BJBARM5_0052 [Candidatus Parvarchaeum acidophilus ARMAN-5]